MGRREMTTFVAFFDFTGEAMTGPCSSMEKAIEVGARLFGNDPGALVVVELPDYHENEALVSAKRRGKVVSDPKRLARSA